MQLGLMRFHPHAEMLGVSNQMHRRRREANEAILIQISYHTSHKKHPHHDASHGIIDHDIKNNNNFNTLHTPKFCDESILTNMDAQAAGVVNESLIEDFNFKPGL